MLIIWELEEATVRGVIKRLGDSEVAYTTVASFVRILEKKKFIGHTSIGSTHLFHPLVTQSEYAKQSLSGLLNKYFEGSFTNLASFFATENDISMKELSEMMREVKGDLNENENNNENRI